MKKVLGLSARIHRKHNHSSYKGEVIVFTLSRSPDLKQVQTMYEKSYQALDKLEQAITDYIFYYNNKGIKAKLKHTKISSEEISDGR